MRRAVRHLLSAGIAVLMVASCAADSPEDVIEPPKQITDAAARYLDDVVAFMRNNSVNRYTIDWPAFESSVRDSAGPAQNIRQTYPGILEAIRLLGDRHTYFLGADGTVLSLSECDVQPRPNETVPPTIGYVRVLPGNPDPRTIRDQIRAADNASIAGWIVDLRGNTGGNLYPMVAGVGPILGEGTAGYFVYPDPQRPQVKWAYRNGGALYGEDEFVFTQIDTPYVLIRPNPKVAVLIDAQTASSGEAVAISFVKRPNTRLFGDHTCGKSTGIEPFTLSDAATLGLATAVMADREHALYPAGVAPDEFVGPSDNPIARAAAWLLSGS